jgi:hypothetical protein
VSGGPAAQAAGFRGVRAWDSRFSESQAAGKLLRFVVDADGD